MWSVYLIRAIKTNKLYTGINKNVLKTRDKRRTVNFLKENLLVYTSPSVYTHKEANLIEYVLKNKRTQLFKMHIVKKQPADLLNFIFYKV
ncbi:Ac79-like [Cotesia congregata filamentous virus 1]|uniref:Ac79-like n=1 Tax=Cotesia congregata filamentous virus 1 TaxID=3064291 RepID=A0ABC8QMV8_9VIRU|nr:Ac79-like [Cotesia congregata filamentous virus 1]